MTSRRIVLIGAGSMVFTRGLLMDLVLSPHLVGSTVALVDRNETKLELMAQLARRIVEQQQAPIHVETSTERRDVLPGADYVITTISVGGQAAWELDLNVPYTYGVIQPVGDSVGPGGLSRALRHIPVILDVAQDMAELCPNAILFNYTNPMTAICRAVARETPVQPASPRFAGGVVGLCHGVPNTRKYLSAYLDVPLDELKVRAAGINHLVWMTQILHNGRDAYPDLRDRLAQQGSCDRPASFELMEIYGLFPGPGHEHVVEFYPHFTSARADYGKSYGVGMFPMEDMNQRRAQRMDEIKAQAEGRHPIVVSPSGEDVMEIITALVTHQTKICAVNVPNKGAVDGLQDFAVVEVSAMVDGGGIAPLRTQSLPAGILGTLQARINQQELTVDAAVQGDYNLALQALLAEPSIGSVADARSMLDELLAAHAAHLPTFR